MITADQIRAGRAMLGWSQAKLADEAGMTREAVLRIESGKSDPRISSMKKIQDAMELAGLVFLPGGVRHG